MQPDWDSKDHAVSADLINQHFCQIRGMDCAPCAYLMREHISPPSTLGPSNDHAKSFNDQMINCYLIIKTLDLLLNMSAPDVEPPLKLYTCKAMEDNAQCFQELKRIVKGIEAEVYVDKFNICSEFCAA